MTTEIEIIAAASAQAARNFAFKLSGIDLALGKWAMEKADAGLTVDEIKGLLSAAMDESGRGEVL